MLQIYNTLTRRKEEFVPVSQGLAGMYVCGPTVYGHSHIGHAKSYVSFDIVARYLRHEGYRVRYVQNITDVGHLTDDTAGMADEGEDKIQRQAREARLDPMEVVELYTASYFEDMDALNIERPQISPRATAHIPEQIELIERLLKKGFAYEAAGSVYYDVHSFEGYGKLSGRKTDELESGVRIEENSDKRHQGDFALWKRADSGHLMRWNSPWGIGYPGWHIECSAMSMKYLGETVDIHGGGVENVFPHHECEIAQSEAATGKQFVRYWMHNNMVTVDGRKMGKSLGNFVTLKDAFRKHSPMTVRLFILGSHYRSPLDFSDQALAAANEGRHRLEKTIRRLRRQIAALGADHIGPGSPQASLVPAADRAQRSTCGGEQDDRGRSAPDGMQATANGATAPREGYSAGQSAPAAPESLRHLPEQFHLLRVRFLEAMDDDFSTPQAVAALFDMVREANSFLDAAGATASGSAGDADSADRHTAPELQARILQAIEDLFHELAGNILGLLKPGFWQSSGVDAGAQEATTLDPHSDSAGSSLLLEESLIDLIVDLRADVRRQKNWELSDRIRDRLAGLGIALEDGVQRTVWTRTGR